MDAVKARSLAESMIGPSGLAHARSADIGITESQIKAIDRHPDDGVLTQDELVLALVADRVSVDEKSGKILNVAFSFVDDKSGPGPKRDLFSGYSALAVRDPQTQPLQGLNPGSYKPAAGTSLEQLSQDVKTPEQVAKLLQPFGSEIYDNDRAKNGTGPGGAQSPEYTLDQRKGICRDSHYLGAYVLQQNGYNARQTGYKTEGVMHAVTTYEGKNGEGFGLIEYGTLYTPEQIAKVLGRPALSHEEALAAVRPEAKIINGYTPNIKGDKEGSIQSLYYTMGHMLYQETLKLKHENSLSYGRNGVELEAALGEHWGLKVQADTGGSPDPTARNSVSGAIGYQAGNQDNWLRVSAGVQYRPQEGHHSVGPNQWESHPALVAGAHAEGQVTALKLKVGDNAQLRTTVGGDLTGAMAFTKGAGTDASNGTVADKWQMNNGLSTGLSHATARVAEHLDAKLGEHLALQSEVFAAPDILAMSMGYGTGGKGLYANTGANASLHYKQGALGAYVGGQYLFSKVNNLEATGASTGISIDTGRISVRADGAMLDSPEGWRLRTSQSVNVKITDSVEAYGFAGQERIYNSKYGNFANPAGNDFGAGVKVKF